VCAELVLADPVHLTGWLDVDGTAWESRRFVVLEITFTCGSTSNDPNFLWARSCIAHGESAGRKGLTTSPASIQRPPLGTQRQTVKCSPITCSVSATAAFAFPTAARLSNAAFSDATSPAFAATAHVISSGSTITTISCPSRVESFPQWRTCEPQHSARPTWTTTAYWTGNRDTFTNAFSRSEWQFHAVAYSTECRPHQCQHECCAESSRLWSATASSTAVCSWSS
jgi:hypothetical protein